MLKHFLCCSSPKVSKEESIGFPQSQEDVLQPSQSIKKIDNQEHQFRYQSRLMSDKKSIELEKQCMIFQNESSFQQYSSEKMTENQDNQYNKENNKSQDSEEELNIPEENSEISYEDLIKRTFYENINSSFYDNFLSLNTQENKKELDSVVYKSQLQQHKKNDLLKTAETLKTESTPKQLSTDCKETQEWIANPNKKGLKISNFHFTPTYYNPKESKSRSKKCINSFNFF